MSPETLKTISQILTQLAAFLIFLAIMKRFAWGPILRLLDERRERIAGEFERIETLKSETDSRRIRSSVVRVMRIMSSLS